MIRTSCPKCGREDAVAAYLTSLPLLCKSCGTRLAIGEALPDRAVFPPPALPVLPPLAITLPDDPDEEEPAVVVIAPAAQSAAEAAFPLPLAGVGRRLLARFLFLVGLVLMGGLGFAVLVFAPKSITRDRPMQLAVVAALPAVYLLANALMLARTGQDVGKRYAGVRIVSGDGSPATPNATLLKRDALTFAVGLTGVGLLYWLFDLVTLFTRRGHCLHDRVAGTRVVRV